MASANDIRTGVSHAQELNIQPSDIVALLDQAIAAALISTDAAGAVSVGLPAVTYTIAGRSRTISLTEAQSLRKYYASIGDSGGIVAQSTELYE